MSMEYLRNFYRITHLSFKDFHISIYSRTQIAVSAQKRLEVKASAIVVLTGFLDSPNLPKEGLSGLKGNFSWRDTLIWSYLEVPVRKGLKMQNMI